MEGEKLFLELKKIGEEIIQNVENNNIGEIEKLTLSRKEIIEEIAKLNLSKYKLEEYVIKNNIVELEEKINKIIKEKMLLIKNEIVRNNTQKRATSRYNTNITKAVFLSREV